MQSDSLNVKMYSSIEADRNINELSNDSYFVNLYIYLDGYKCLDQTKST